MNLEFFCVYPKHSQNRWAFLSLAAWFYNDLALVELVKKVSFPFIISGQRRSHRVRKSSEAPGFQSDVCVKVFGKSGDHIGLAGRSVQTLDPPFLRRWKAPLPSPTLLCFFQQWLSETVLSSTPETWAYGMQRSRVGTQEGVCQLPNLFSGKIRNCSFQHFLKILPEVRSSSRSPVIWHQRRGLTVANFWIRVAV